MFSVHQLTGRSLPAKTLCLTFDDGPGETVRVSPGPKTREIAEYLYEQEISATFFVVGRFVVRYPYILSEVAGLGHRIANHTYNHPDLERLFAEGGDCVTEIRRTSELIMDCIPDKKIFFRAPYGLWSPALADLLNQHSAVCEGITGPYYWDIDGRDWEHWRHDHSAVESAQIYLKEIIRVNRGIVLMHDSSADSDELRGKNRTLEMIRVLIPQLRELGYRFIRLDEVPPAEVPSG